MRIILTVDVEADNQWSFDGTISTDNLRRLPGFQSLCESYGFAPTYLVAYECLENRDIASAMRVWQEKGAAEIGAHLEPWTTPPFLREEVRNPAMQAFPCELPPDIFAQKLETLTGEIERTMGRAPRSFRAARWGMSGNMIPELLRQGYIADGSVTPKLDWRRMTGMPGGPGGPDFRQAPVAPYWPSTEDINKSGCGQLLEVPMTILCTGPLVREDSILTRWFSRLGDGIMRQLLNRIIFRGEWLRIGPHSRPRGWEAVYRAAKRNKLDILEFMIHSSELMPGGSPLVRTEQHAEAVMERMSAMLEYFRDRGVTGCTLEQCVAWEKEKRRENSRYGLSQSSL